MQITFLPNTVLHNFQTVTLFHLQITVSILTAYKQNLFVEKIFCVCVHLPLPEICTQANQPLKKIVSAAVSYEDMAEVNWEKLPSSRVCLNKI